MERSAWIRSVERRPDSVAQAIEDGLAAVGRLPSSPGERWAIKLNLTYPIYLPGVVNAPEFVEGLCRWGADRGVALTFLEGDGGNGAYSAEDTFEGNGVTGLARTYGMKCASLSREPWEYRETPVREKLVRLPYSPFFRSREYDRFVTTPLFKNHINTYATLGMKNLWGCIPDSYRILSHWILDHGIVALYKELLPDFSIFDGLIAMRGRGPLEGLALDMDLVMTCSDVGAGESAALEVMGIPLERVNHLKIAAAEGLLPAPGELRWLTDPKPFVRDDFVISRTLLNHLTVNIARYPRLQRLVYHSPMSSVIYAIVNRLRGNSAQTRLFKDKKAGRYRSISLQDREMMLITRENPTLPPRPNP